MKFRVETTSQSERDFWTCYDYIYERNPDGALRWVDAFDEALQSLETDPHRGLAPESEGHDEEIRQRIFKTRHGLPHRILFVVRGNVIHIIHVRGPGQDVMARDKVELPGEDEP